MTWIIFVIFPCVIWPGSECVCSIRHRVFETVYTTWANQNKVNIVRLYYCIVCSFSLYTSCKCRKNFVSRHFVNLGVKIKCFWVCQSKLRFRSACYKTLHGSSHAYFLTYVTYTLIFIIMPHKEFRKTFFNLIIASFIVSLFKEWTFSM